MKCKVCGKRFALRKENKYLAKAYAEGIVILFDSGKTYDAFDCPKCGCQNLVAIREPEVGLLKEGDENE